MLNNLLPIFVNFDGLYKFWNLCPKLLFYFRFSAKYGKEYRYYLISKAISYMGINYSFGTYLTLVLSSQYRTLNYSAKSASS